MIINNQTQTGKDEAELPQPWSVRAHSCHSIWFTAAKVMVEVEIKRSKNTGNQNLRGRMYNVEEEKKMREKRKQVVVELTLGQPIGCKLSWWLVSVRLAL